MLAARLRIVPASFTSRIWPLMLCMTRREFDQRLELLHRHAMLRQLHALAER